MDWPRCQGRASITFYPDGNVQTCTLWTGVSVTNSYGTPPSSNWSESFSCMANFPIGFDVTGHVVLCTSAQDQGAGNAQCGKGSTITVDSRGVVSCAPPRGSGGSPRTLKADWATQPNQLELRGRNGERFEIHCPPGGTISNQLWGTDLYTDDSSLCTAAVHAGVITLGKGGTVTIEIRPGVSSYKGSVRHRVTSKDWGAFDGSFVLVGSHR